MILKAGDDLLLGGAAADIEEVGRAAAEVLDDVHRGSWRDRRR
jgi:sorbitol-specific phosphotransferase system component IIA